MSSPRSLPASPPTWPGSQLPRTIHPVKPPPVDTGTAVPRFRTIFDNNGVETAATVIDASNALFDIDADANSQPPDVLAYIYLVGSEYPTPDMADKDAAVRRGLERLRAARRNKKGLFLEHLEEGALAHFPTFPYLHNLDLDALEMYQDFTAHPEKKCRVNEVGHSVLATTACAVLLGNVRVPLPACFEIEPDHDRWLELIAAVYSYAHPVGGRVDQWLTSGLTDEGLRRWIRQNLGLSFPEHFYAETTLDWEPLASSDYE